MSPGASNGVFDDDMVDGATPPSLEPGSASPLNTHPTPQQHNPAAAALRRNRFLAWLGLAGIAEFVIAVIALHAFSDDPNHLSDFARSQYAWLWAAGAYSFAVAGIAITIGLQSHLRGGPFARAGLTLLWTAALGALLIATFPTDATPRPQTVAGTIHNDAVWPTFGALGIAMLVLPAALRSRPSWRRFADFSVVLGLLVSALGVAYVLTEMHSMPLVAVVQRAIVALIACWFIVLGVNLLFIHPHHHAPGDPPVAAASSAGAITAVAAVGTAVGGAVATAVGTAAGTATTPAPTEGEFRPSPHKT